MRRGLSACSYALRASLRPATLALLLLLLCQPYELIAGEVSGRAKVLDGDSLRIDRVEIRLHGIDAPEFTQTCRTNGVPWNCGRTATEALRQMIGSAPVRCTWEERDRYARALATCYVEGANINAELVAQGLALAYTKYSDRYAKEELSAQSATRGLWRSEFEPPWIWRQKHPRTARRPSP